MHRVTGSLLCAECAPHPAQAPQEILTFEQHDNGQLVERVVHHRVTAVIDPFCILHMQSRTMIEASRCVVCNHTTTCHGQTCVGGEMSKLGLTSVAA